MKEKQHIEIDDLYEILASIYVEIDVLLKKLAPEGWNNSPYHFPFTYIEGEREALNQPYVIVYKAYEAQFGTIGKNYLQDRVREVDLMIPINGETSSASELVFLIEHTLIQLNENGLFFKTDAPDMFFYMDDEDILWQSDMVAVELNLPDALQYYPMSQARADMLHHMDLSEIYMLVFAVLDRTGYDWRYCNDALLDICRISRIKTLTKNITDKKENNRTLGKLQEQLNKVLAARPSDDVIGYTLLQDRAPLGYPPTLENLQEIIIDEEY